MAMMMTGRVLLLVCALCVLWCGAGGRCDEGVVESRAGVSGIGVDPLPASKGIGTSLQGVKDLKDEAGVKGKKTPTSAQDEAEEDEEEDDDDDEADEDTKAVEEKSTERQGGQEVTVALDSNSREKNLSGSDHENHQAIVSAEVIPPSGSRETNANSTQTRIEEGKDAEKSSPAVENTLTKGNGDKTLPAGIAGGNLSPPPEEGVDSRKQDGKDTTSEDEKNVPSPETAATPQSHRDKGSEGTGDDTKATTATANTTGTTNTQNSDDSTAVSHTTSPLLLLLVVACAAAAAVVAA
ncbi:Mucin-associated surface protein (MASP) subgroup S037 [Trypanosoma cruzi]|uniref:Mucin-associated surface protein (MASP) subgroup S037 n=1 Tax=Trypanosoma cruzi TaxID=5693 RepID=A0A7J6XQQ6_TRYCR|nr:Mucin-associated surface protein (MASP) subgroup S037 [Trypanosoma cruzi]